MHVLIALNLNCLNKYKNGKYFNNVLIKQDITRFLKIPPEHYEAA